MKKLMLLCAAGVAMLAGCASQPAANQSADQIAANVHTQVVKACAVVVPTLASLDAMKPQMTADQAVDLAKAEAIVTPICSAQSAPITSVAQLVNVGFPLAIKIVAASPLKDQDKTTAEIALTAASIAVSAALAQYAPAAAVPASSGA